MSNSNDTTKEDIDIGRKSQTKNKSFCSLECLQKFKNTIYATCETCKLNLINQWETTSMIFFTFIHRNALINL